MATQKGYLAPQSLNEMVGVVVGLYGDPANQDAGNDGININSAYSWISWAGDLPHKVLFWSRVLLVELLTPHDVNFVGSRLTLVAKPRAVWLYDKGGGQVADFVGNTTSASTIGQPTDTKIGEPKPPYRYGDIIRVGTLPTPITLNGWGENIYRNAVSADEQYDGDMNTGTVRNPALTVTNLTITGYGDYANFSPTEIVFYDRNIDARTRYGGTGTTDSGDEVNVALCLGGITSIYRLKGQKLT